MAEYYVTWEETTLVGAYVEARSEEEAIAVARESAIGSFIEWISDANAVAEEA